MRLQHVSPLVLALAASFAVAQPNTAFTYQGELKDGGLLANGSYDITFNILDAATGGNLVRTECFNDIPVTNGRFALDLNSGTLPQGRAYYIELATRRHTAGITCRDDTGFTTLVPRQRLNAAPIANQALYATALTAPDGNPGTALSVLNDGNMQSSFNLGVAGRLGAGTTAPETPFDLRTGSSYFKIDAFGDARFNGGFDSDFGFFNEGSSLGGTYFFNNGHRPLSLLNNGRVGIGTPTPAKTLTVAGDMEIGTSHGDYRHLRIGGGNSSGFLYGSFPVLADGIHMGYNYYADSTGGRVIARDGATSRITVGYGYVGLATGAVNAPPVDRLTIRESGNVGIGTEFPGAKLHVAGNIICSNLTQTSSAAFKDEITPLSQGLNDLMKLEPVSYVWNDKAPEQARGKHDLGFIAEEVAKILPDAVALDAEGKVTGIDYSRITVLAVKAIKEQQTRHDADRQEIQTLRERLEQLEALLRKGAN